MVAVLYCRPTGKQLVVGSEPFDSTRSDWRTLPNGHYLYAQSSHGLVAVKTGVLPAPTPVPRPVA